VTTDSAETLDVTAVCPDWVDAEPFRAHVRDLICETGLSWRLVAAHAGVAPRAVRSLLHGRRGYTLHRLHVSVARALTTTSIESIAADQHLVTDATTTRQLIADLRAAGHGPHLDRHLPPGDLAQLDDPQAWRCSRATAARVTACYDLLTTVARGPGRSHADHVASPTPTTPPVESDPQKPLDRKQTSGAWTTGSSSTPTAGRSGR
jgi:hypothetical protein